MNAAVPAGARPRVGACGARLPLAPVQEGFWLLHALQPGHAGGNEQFAIALDGPLDPQALAAAWQALLERQAILRTRFGTDDGVPWQQIGACAAPPLRRVDAGPDPQALQVLAVGEIGAPFDLGGEQAPLRALLARLGPMTHVLLVTVHHIVADGLSVPVIRDELARDYALRRAGRTPGPAAVAGLDYAGFVGGGAGAIGAGVAAQALEWWRAQLAGAPARHALPQLAAPGATLDGRARRLPFEIPATTATRLRALARAQGVTLYTVLLAAFRTLLVRLGGQDDVLISSPVTLRDDPALRDTVGCLLNNAIFRTPAAGDPSFAELLRRERDTLFGVLSQRQLPFTRIVQALAPVRRPGEQPLSQILFQFGSRVPDRMAADVVFRIEPVHADRASWWDLEWSLTDQGEGEALVGHFCYAQARFEPWVIEPWPAYFATLLEAVVDAPHTSLSALPLLDAATRERVLAGWNATDAPYPEQATLHGPVAARCRAQPAAVALRAGAQTVSYGELGQRVAGLSARLAQLGVGAGDCVGLALPPSVDLVVGLLAILRRGAAFVPLDPAYPPARLAFMLGDSGARVLVTHRGLLEAPGVTRLELDGGDGWATPGVAIAEPADDPDSPAFVLYTSGSTGEPKGAVGLHRGAVNRCHWMWQAHGFGADDVFCLRTSINFIDSLWEIFGALMHGIPLVILPAAAARDPALLVPALAGAGVTQLVLVPPLLRALLDGLRASGASLPRLRVIVTSGEPLTPELLAACRRTLPAVRVLNTYGTSEIWDASCCEASALPDDLARVPIGAPIANMRCYVLDRHLQPVPPGIPGELCVGGVGIGAGYWRRPGLTAERFVPDPFAPGPAARLYRSGDLARWRGDGTLECLGRMDRQMKLRGYRIEPAEIEAVLRAVAGVSDAAVVLRGDGERAQLVAYVALEPGATDPAPLRGLLRDRLPAFMQPSAWVVLERLPLTPSGKVDRDALPAPAPGARAGARAPADALEAQLAGLWAEVLGLAAVGVDENFFDLGGHSLLAMRVLARAAAACAVTLTLADLFEAPSVAAMAARIRARQGAIAATPRPAAGLRSGDLPLSFGQERLWFLGQLDPGSPAYHLAWTVRARGPLEIARLQAALDALIARHESLRSVFPADDGQPRQVILDTLAVAVDVEACAPAQIAGRAAELARLPFELATGPLLRLGVLRLAPDLHELVFVVHHIVTDGASNAILLRELVTLYEGGTLAPLPLHYADFALWQRRQAAATGARHLDWWRARLAGAPAALALPSDFPRPPEQSFRGAWVWRALPAAHYERLARFARERDTTPYMLLLAAFKVLLARWSGASDLVVGTPVSLRPDAALEPLVGLFVNTLALRTATGDDPDFETFLRRVRTTAVEALEHQALPFEQLVEALAPERSLARSPVFQVMFNLVQIPQRELGTGAVRFSLGRLLDHGVSSFDLTLTVGEHDGGCELVWEYATDLFRPRTIEQVAAAFEALLDGVLAAPHTALSALPLGGPARAAAIPEGAGGQAPAQETVAALFAAQVAADPGREAVVGAGQRWSYATLAAAAGRVAAALAARGVGRGARVGVCLPRTPELIAAPLGVLQAGAACVMLDPDYPQARLHDMAGDAQLALVIASPATAAQVGRLDVPWLDVDELPPAGRLPAVAVHPADPAYLVYTSGSTGRPKGVVVSHGALAATFRGWARAWDLGPQDTHLQMAAPSFDVFTGDWVRALLSGGRLVLCPREVLLDPPQLHALLAGERISVAEFVPGVVRPLLAWLDAGGGSLAGLRLLIVGSDTWHLHEARALARHVAPATRIINSYGVAEACIDSAWFECAHAEPGDGVVPIGRPFAQVRLRVVDAALADLPALMPGELLIGGAGLATGYWNREAENAQRFWVDPRDGQRYYRTGDRARLRGDGVIEFLGRLDGQLKVRGFRIEPGEVESALGALPGVQGCAVGVREGPGGDGRLVAWVVGEEVQGSRLRAALRVRLPDYMVPSMYVGVEELPLTANGKLDRSRLPAPRWEGEARADRVGPRDGLEALLVELFGEVLGRSAAGLGVHEDFFALGGHSLLATKLVARIRDALAVELALRTLFEGPTVAELAGALRAAVGAVEAGAAVAPPERIARRTGRREAPLSWPQQRLWFLEQLEPGSAAYHLHAAWRLRGTVDRAALERALGAVVERHEALRTVFVERDGEARQVLVAKPAGALLGVRELGAGEDLERLLRERVEAPFDLTTGPLWRVEHIGTGAGEGVLLVVMHHIISDGWSLALFIGELSVAYGVQYQPVLPALPDRGVPEVAPRYSLGSGTPDQAEQFDGEKLPIQYGDYAEWQRGRLGSAELARQLAYWREQLAGAPPLIHLPTDRPRRALQRHRGARVHRQLAAPRVATLHALARAQGCTLYMVLLAAFEVVLGRYGGDEEFLVGTPVAGRSRTELEGLIGFFVNTLVLRADLRGDPRFTALLGRVKATALGAYAHAEVPFERLVEELRPVRDPGRTPLFQVMFNLHTEPAQQLALPGVQAERFAVVRGTSKFDLGASLVEHAGGLAVTFEYDTDLFDAVTMEAMLESYAEVLEAVAGDGELRVSEIALAGAGARAARERARLRARVGSREAQLPASPEPVAGTLWSRFSARAAEDRAHLAAQWATGRLSYAELHGAAAALGAGIEARFGAGGAGRMALLLGHDGAMLTGLLGVLAAGRAYVPLDPWAPPARNVQILRAAGVEAVVTDGAHLEAAPWLGEIGVPVVVVDAASGGWVDAAVSRAGGRESRPKASIGERRRERSAIDRPPFDQDSTDAASSAAYVLYTSGTTGAAKGVVQTQAGALGQVDTWARQLGLGAQDRLSLLAGYGYDAAVQDIFGALLSGASVHLLDLRGEASGPELIDRIAAEGVTVLHLTPTVFRHLFGGRVTCTQDLSRVRLVVLGGEEARRTDFELFRVRFAEQAVLVNGLGLTESTTALQWFADRHTRVLGQRLPVGVAVPGARLQLVAGSPDARTACAWRGELWLQHPYLAAGYDGDEPAGSAFRRDAAGERWLATGDVLRRLPDGQYVHEGRVDRQVKLRGIRIEPAGIEALVRELSGGGECAVVLRPGADGEAQLVAYLVAADTAPTAEALRERLRERLPEALVPAAFVWVEALPRRANGKLDEDRLPAPSQAPRAAASAPRGEIEQRLQAIWQDLLGREPIGVEEDFFAIGGHSLAATRLIARVRDAFALEVPLLAVFENPTIAGMAARLAAMAHEARDPALQPVTPLARRSRPS
jgi:amino acid adenylation domain-containing protein